MQTLNREKYFEILKTEGLSAALTTLHRDAEVMEFETFEGRDGYDEANYRYLETVREFSRELWRSPLETGKVNSHSSGSSSKV